MLLLVKDFMKKSTHKHSSPMLPSSVTNVTLFSRFLVLFLFILLPLAGFYVGINYQQLFDAQATAVSSQSVASQSAKPTTAAVLFIRASDNNKSFSIPQGTHINFALSNSLHWKLVSNNTTVVGSLGKSSSQFTALKKGTAVLSATGTPICKSSAPCPLYAAIFKVTITVK